MKKPLIITKKYPETDFNACIMTEEHISNDGDLIPIKALWDTGSSESVISSELVKKLNLHSIGNDYKNINQRNLAPKMTPKTGIEFAT